MHCCSQSVLECEDAEGVRASMRRKADQHRVRCVCDLNSVSDGTHPLHASATIYALQLKIDSDPMLCTCCPHAALLQLRDSMDEIHPARSRLLKSVRAQRPFAHNSSGVTLSVHDELIGA